MQIKFSNQTKKKMQKRCSRQRAELWRSVYARNSGGITKHAGPRLKTKTEEKNWKNQAPNIGANGMREKIVFGLEERNGSRRWTGFKMEVLKATQQKSTFSGGRVKSYQFCFMIFFAWEMLWFLVLWGRALRFGRGPIHYFIIQRKHATTSLFSIEKLMTWHLVENTSYVYVMTTKCPKVTISIIIWKYSSIQ